jgi:type III secretion protein, HrpO family
MSEGEIMVLMGKALTLVLVLSLPPIIVAALVGVLVSLLQALTQIQEQTLSFAIKLIAVAVTIAMVAQFIGVEIFNFTIFVFDRLALIS